VQLAGNTITFEHNMVEDKKANTEDEDNADDHSDTNEQ